MYPASSLPLLLSILPNSSRSGSKVTFIWILHFKVDLIGEPGRPKARICKTPERVPLRPRVCERNHREEGDREKDPLNMCIKSSILKSLLLFTLNVERLNAFLLCLVSALIICVLPCNQTPSQCDKARKTHRQHKIGIKLSLSLADRDVYIKNPQNL